MSELIGGLIGLAILFAAVLMAYMFFTSQAILISSESGNWTYGSYVRCTYFTGVDTIDVPLSSSLCPRWAKITSEGLRFP